MEDKAINEQESLQIITRMIQNTQKKMVKNEGTTFLVWGYVTLAVTIAVGLTLYYSGNWRWNYLWFAIPVIGAPLNAIFRHRNQKGVRTYIDTVLKYVWLVLGVACFFASVLSIVSGLYNNILFIVPLVIGSGSAITGMVVKFTPTTVGGFLGMAFGALTLFFPRYSLIIFALTFVVMMIIPGHILNFKSRRLNKTEEAGDVQGA
jgi:MFS family permease